jgi:hypothetical protein
MSAENWIPPAPGEFLAYLSRKQQIIVRIRIILQVGNWLLAIISWLSFFFLVYDSEDLTIKWFYVSLSFIVGTLSLLCTSFVSLDWREGVFLDFDETLKYSSPKWHRLNSHIIPIKSRVILLNNQLIFLDNVNGGYSIPDRFHAHPEKLLMWINEHIESNK